MKNVISQLGKSLLIPLGLTAVASAADAAIRKNIFRSGSTTLITSNDEIEKVIEIVKSLDDSGLSLKGPSETIQNVANVQKGGFLRMLLGTRGDNVLGNMLAGKRIAREGYGSKDFQSNGDDRIRGGY